MHVMLVLSLLGMKLLQFFVFFVLALEPNASQCRLIF